MSEKDWITRYFAPLAYAQGADSLGDDVAILDVAERLIVTQDALVEGIHFRSDDPIETVARKLVRVNVSDILAKGALPRQALLTLGWPKTRPEMQLADFANACGEELAEWRVELIGGDTVTVPRDMFFSLTLTGHSLGTGPVRRSGAEPGQEVWVTGLIGAAKRGFDREPEWHQAYLLPSLPPVHIAPLIAQHATAAMDVSDGLLGDARQLALASQVSVSIDLDAVPFAGEPGELAERLALATWGDDYQVLFTAPANRHEKIVRTAREYGLKIANIGHIEAGAGLKVSANGAQINLPETLGFEHG